MFYIRKKIPNLKELNLQNNTKYAFKRQLCKKNNKTKSLITLMWFAREVHRTLNYKILLKELWTIAKFSLKLNYRGIS